MAEGLYDFVVSGYDIMQEYANEAFEVALNFIDKLEQQAVLLEIPDITYEWKPLPSIPDMSKAVAPTAPTLLPSFPTPPSDFEPGEIYPPTFPSPPDFDVSDPSINYPDVPPPLDIGDVPTVPDTDTDFIYPDAPVYTLPSAPTLESISLPTLEPIDYPELTAVIPEENIVTPDLTFNWEEEDYTDNGLYDAIQDKLLDTIQNGGTGLNPIVEQAIWDRERNREDQAALKAKAEVREEWAKRGYSLPPGAEFAALKEVAIATQDKIVSLGRDIAIKQAELEQENLRHAISETVRLEGVLLDYYSSKMQRQFEAARYIQEAAISIANAQIAIYNTRLQGYNIQVQAFNTLMQAELAKVEVYKSEIEAQSLIVDINRSNVEVYTAQLDAIKTQSEIYATELNAIRTKLDAEKTKIDIYLGELQGYTTQLEAKRVEYDLYKTQLDGEISKVQLYEAQVGAYATRINAYSSQVDAEAKTSEVQIAHEDLRLRSYTNRLEAYRTEVEAESTRLKAETDVFISEVNAYSELTKAYSTEFDAGVKQFEAAIAENESLAKLELAQSEANIRKLIETNKFLVETIKAGAMVSSELASAALSAINLSAGMSASGSESTQHNYNYEV
jgi:hypothetical protein